jgi:hypothetical protein
MWLGYSKERTLCRAEILQPINFINAAQVDGVVHTFLTSGGNKRSFGRSPWKVDKRRSLQELHRPTEILC